MGSKVLCLIDEDTSFLFELPALPVVCFVRWKAVLVRWCCFPLGCVRVVWLVILNYPHPRPLKEVCQSSVRAGPRHDGVHVATGTMAHKRGLSSRLRKFSVSGSAGHRCHGAWHPDSSSFRLFYASRTALSWG